MAALGTAQTTRQGDARQWRLRGFDPRFALPFGHRLIAGRGDLGEHRVGHLGHSHERGFGPGVGFGLGRHLDVAGDVARGFDVTQGLAPRGLAVVRGLVVTGRVVAVIGVIRRGLGGCLDDVGVDR